MLVKFYGVLATQYAPIEVIGDDMRQILSLLKLNCGEELTNNLLSNKFYYIVENEEVKVGLTPDTVLTNLNQFHTLHIVPEVEGDVDGGMLVAIGLFAATGFAASATAFVINVGLAIALSYLMSKLSPTPQVQSDPGIMQERERSSTQRNTSNLFSSSTIRREIGCPVPLIFGNPYHGGVLIASGIFTEDTDDMQTEEV